jgi:prepilin-type N-terminal cleavage/methylation domain-containing protein
VKGFTLIEMLVAIGLMALMAIICWRGLAFVANQRGAIEGESVELAQLLRSFAQIERDLDERLPDIAVPARATAAELPLAVSVLPAENGNVVLEIFRSSPDTQPPLHIAYRVSRQGLVRSSPGGEVLVLPGAARLRVRLHAGGFWLEPGREQSVRPIARASALEIAVEDGNGARYVKVVAL